VSPTEEEENRSAPPEGMVPFYRHGIERTVPYTIYEIAATFFCGSIHVEIKCGPEKEAEVMNHVKTMN
jgi:hypothetical protein